MKRAGKQINRIIKQACYPFTAGIIIFLGYILKKMSWDKARRSACLLGDFAYMVLRVRRRLVEKNLTHAFPDKSPQEIRTTARQVYRNQVLNFVEMLRIPLIKDRADADSHVMIKASENLLERIARQKGAVVVSGHLGSWEMIGVCTCILLGPANYVIKPIKNRYLDRYLLRLRTMHGNKVVFKEKSLRQGLKVLQNGELLVVLGDQSNKKGDFYVEFMGRKATIFLGPAFWALKAGVPLFVETSKRLDNGRYLIEVVEIPTNDLCYNRKDIKSLAMRYTKVLEGFILKHPEEWLWMHDRWKKSPP